MSKTVSTNAYQQKLQELMLTTERNYNKQIYHNTLNGIFYRTEVGCSMLDIQPNPLMIGMLFIVYLICY